MIQQNNIKFTNIKSDEKNMEYKKFILKIDKIVLTWSYFYAKNTIFFFIFFCKNFLYLKNFYKIIFFWLCEQHLLFYLLKKKNNKLLSLVDYDLLSKINKNLLYLDTQYDFFYNSYDIHLNNLKKKEIKRIEKGYKIRTTGICVIKKFLKSEKNMYYDKTLKKFILIVHLKKKNLFLTLLETNGNVLSNINVGRCGFKRKYKLTGYSIKSTSKYFSVKIKKAFFLKMYSISKKCKKRLQKIHDLIFLRKKIIKQKKNILKVKKKKLWLNFIKNWKKGDINSIIWYKNNIILNYFLKNKKNKNILNKNNYFFKTILKYRMYPKFRKALKKKFKIILRFKSSTRHWGTQFVIYGIGKFFSWFNNFEVRIPLPHSKGLRLKKKRRI